MNKFEERYEIRKRNPKDLCHRCSSLASRVDNNYRLWCDRCAEASIKAHRKANPLRVNKPGRNEPCTCGSGLKYKKCHGK